MSLTLTLPPVPSLHALALTSTHVAAHAPLDDAARAAPALSRPDIVEEWGKQSFPASDPPSNW